MVGKGVRKALRRLTCRNNNHATGNITFGSTDGPMTMRMDRWVGLGVIADNVVKIGRAIEKQAAP
jgi:hypothetical protein